MALLNIRLGPLYIGVDAKLNAWVKDQATAMDSVISAVNTLDSRQPTRLATWAEITAKPTTIKPAKGALVLIEDHPMRGPCLLVGDGSVWHMFERLDTYDPAA